MKDLVTIDDEGRRENHGVIQAKRQVGDMTLYLLRDKRGKVLVWQPPDQGIRKMWFIRKPADARHVFDAMTEDEMLREYRPSNDD